ncbi:MAG: DNA alkylation repair protein [Candidatus Obscuribacterales bacterium]|nr:DNA alkylation repair protein [Candidatus Obscuribacterales bacterium]
MSTYAKNLVRLVQKELKAKRNSAKAKEMAAYMKTDMPFYGVQKPDRALIYKQLKSDFKPSSLKEYQDGIRALWELDHREEKYTALTLACQNDEFIMSKSLPLFEELIREGAWWDFVDVIAIDLVGRALLKEKKLLKPVMYKWIDDHDFWIRRTAIISQNKHKIETDEAQLFEHCLTCAHEKEFFIRKAIGWALRNYSYTQPQSVKKFLKNNRQILSPLSYREGAKQLMRVGSIKST